MLLGQYSTKVSIKNRVALPHKFRGELGDSAIVARWYEGCLVIVSKDKWINLMNRLTGSTQIVTKPVRDTDRFIMGSAFEIKTDSQGRFVLPKHLVDYAKLVEEITFIGLGDRVEIWNKKDWEKKESEIISVADNLVEKLVVSLN